MRDWIRRHRNLTLVGVIVGALAVVFVFIWFEPHKAFIDERVDETIPTAAPTSTTAAARTTEATSEPSGSTETTTSTTAAPTTTAAAATFPLIVSESTFVDVAHGGSGTVLALELEDGSRIIRFEDLDVDNGPDLVVILSDRPITGADDYADGEWVSLGELKGNQGNQNYEIPDDVDLSEWETVAIWCRRFNTTFNAAPLES